MSRGGGPAPRPDRGLQLLRNALSGGGRFAIGALTALLVTPFALSHLGDARFGLWALAGAAIGLVRLLDLGLVRALTREVASALGSGTADDAASAVRSARALMLLLGAGSILTAWWLREPLLAGLLALPPPLRAEAGYVLIGSVAVAALEGAFAPYQAALDGLGRMDLSNVVDGLVQRLLSPLGVLLVLGAGWGLRGLIWKNLVLALLAGLIYAGLLGRLAPALRAGAPRLDRAATRRLLAFGRHVQAVNLGSALIDPVAKTLLGRGAGLETVALYELANRVTGQLGGACMALSNALFPAAAELAAAGTGSDAARARLVALHRRATRYTAWLVLPAWLILIALAPLLFEAWVGPGYADSARALRLMSGGWILALLALPAFLLAQAGGQPRISTVGGLVTPAVSIGLCLLLVEPLGLAGAGLATSAGLAAGALVTLGLFARRFGLGAAEALPLGWRGPLAALAGAGLALVLAEAFAGGSGAAAGLPALGLAGLLGGSASGLLLLAGGEIGAEERRLLARLLGRQPDGRLR